MEVCMLLYVGLAVLLLLAPQPWRLRRAGHYLGLGMAALFCLGGARIIEGYRGDGLLFGIVLLMLWARFLIRSAWGKARLGGFLGVLPAAQRLCVRHCVC